MQQRQRFIAAVQRREASMAVLCRQYGISRKTAYKWVGRHTSDPVSGLQARSRARHTQSHAVGQEVEDRILALRGQHPTWGPKKLRWELVRQDPATRWPATSTIGTLLDRAGLVVHRPRRPRRVPATTLLAHADGPNAVWTADFKGDLVSTDGQPCHPLTIADAHSRYLLRCQALIQTDTARVQPLFQATFREYGLPTAIRTDNGPPFASVGLAGLTPLSVWWLKLGIVVERIAPGKPQQNGRHERLHRTLAEDAARPPAASVAAQQRALDQFRSVYNEGRPHEALGMVTPASVYAPSPRSYPERLPLVHYPDADAVRRVKHSGEFRWHSAAVYLTAALAGEPVGLSWVADGQWHVHFSSLLLGVLDERVRKIFPVCPCPRAGADRAAGAPDVSPMCPV